ncbi:MAG: hypothetical protein EXR65_03325 [Dehalococcoidia bacterium]|nr:hypothetical protein [Dehalococcoidia bacterium]
MSVARAAGRWRSLRTAGLLTLALGALLLSGCEGKASPLEDRLAVQGAVLLSVLVDDGEVVIEVGEPGAVVVSGSMDPDRYRYAAYVDESRVRLELRRTRSLLTLLRSGHAQLRVTVPPGTRLDVAASNGAVTATGPLGGGRLATSNAAIEASVIDGDLVATTSNGGVRVAAQHGAITISSSNGPVTVSHHDGGAVNIATSNGAVEFAGTIQLGTENSLRTSNGALVLTLAGDLSAMLDAATSNAPVASRYAVIDPQRGASHLKGRIAGGAATLKLRTSNGAIELR